MWQPSQMVNPYLNEHLHFRLERFFDYSKTSNARKKIEYLANDEKEC
jgi:hypothetical protein